MYSWDEDTSDWYGKATYSYGPAGSTARTIGDAAADQWPLQVTNFAGGFDLEQLLGSLYGEGGGGDAPESYGLFAHWVNTHVEVPNPSEPPFLILFGDAPMHLTVPKNQIAHYLGDRANGEVDAIKAWQQLCKKWNVWFLRRPTGRPGDSVDQQWGRAITEQKIFHIEDEQRDREIHMQVNKLALATRGLNGGLLLRSVRRVTWWDRFFDGAGI
ncbi:MAG: hypothetical protein HYR94_12440 [Chloroflexi bacterium]|nr:hypothetical protein [Chloroflexota bacterium]